MARTESTIAKEGMEGIAAIRSAEKVAKEWSEIAANEALPESVRNVAKSTIAMNVNHVQDIKDGIFRLVNKEMKKLDTDKLEKLLKTISASL
jgi:hypothetical protein